MLGALLMIGAGGVPRASRRFYGGSSGLSAWPRGSRVGAIWVGGPLVRGGVDPTPAWRSHISRPAVHGYVLGSVSSDAR